MTSHRLSHCPAALASLVLCLVLLAGCASTPGSPSLYVLDSATADISDAPQQPGAPTLMIMPVTTAAYLAKGGLVYQTGPHRIVIANNNLWASPLSDQLTDALHAALDSNLPGINIVHASSRQDGVYILETRVDQFLGHYDGNAHVSGQWTLLAPNGNKAAGHPFNITVPLKADGYPALVNSLASGWRRVGRQMAEQLKPRLRGHVRSY